MNKRLSPIGFPILMLVVCAMLANTVDAQARARARDRKARDLAFQGKIYLGDRVLENGTILIRDGKVAAVGKGIEIPAGIRVQKLGTSTITPGLIDASREGLYVRGLIPQSSEVVAGYEMADAIDFNQDSLKRLRLEGVTTVYASVPGEAVVGPQGAVIKTGTLGTARLLQKSHEPRLTLSHEPVRGNRRPGSGRANTLYTRRPTTQMSLNFVAREAFVNAANYRRANPKGGSDIHMNTLAEVLSGKRRIRIRGDRQYEIATGLRMGREFGFLSVVEGGTEAWRLADQIVKDKALLIYGPVRTGIYARSTNGIRNPIGAIKTLKAKGVSFAITAKQGLLERGLARQGTFALRYGLTHAEVVAATTLIPARILGVEKKVGQLAKGCDADFIIWRGEPFEATSAMHMVFTDGIPVAAKGF